MHLLVKKAHTHVPVLTLYNYSQALISYWISGLFDNYFTNPLRLKFLQYLIRYNIVRGACLIFFFGRNASS